METGPMRALLGASFGPGHECLVRCIKCSNAVIVMLPEEPIRGQHAQIVTKHECPTCGQTLYATTCTTGQAMLATHCRILNGQMQLGNPVELNIDRAGGANFVGGNRPIPTLLVVGRGKDGQMTLLSSEDMGMNPI